jgi:hypothetical protein
LGSQRLKGVGEAAAVPLQYSLIASLLTILVGLAVVRVSSLSGTPGQVG